MVTTSTFNSFSHNLPLGQLAYSTLFKWMSNPKPWQKTQHRIYTTEWKRPRKNILTLTWLPFEIPISDLALESGCRILTEVNHSGPEHNPTNRWACLRIRPVKPTNPKPPWKASPCPQETLYKLWTLFSLLQLLTGGSHHPPTPGILLTNKSRVRFVAQCDIVAVTTSLESERTGPK